MRIRGRMCSAPGPDVLGPDIRVVAVVFTDRRLEVVVVFAARVGLIAEHHPGPLMVAHSVRARVGQEVDVDVLGAKEKGVVARLPDRTLPVFAGVVVLRGSTTLIFNGSAHDRRLPSGTEHLPMRPYANQAI